MPGWRTALAAGYLAHFSLLGLVTAGRDDGGHRFEREAGRGYYRELCFKVNVLAGDGWAEVGDGGLTDWTARLMASGKERLLISGLGIDRLAALTAGAP